MRKKLMILGIVAALATTGAVAFSAPKVAGESAAVAKKEVNQVVFKNVNIFNGTDNKLYKNHIVVVTGNLISGVYPSMKGVQISKDATVIDGKGRTLMPALIDSHTHLKLNGTGLADINNNRTDTELSIKAAQMAKLYIDLGFGTVRDMGGMDGTLGRLVDDGVIPGPRIYNAGGFLSGYGGHADFGNLNDDLRTISSGEKKGITHIVTGKDEVRKAARSNFRMGATHLKIMQTGGVASLFDPWQLNGLQKDEIEGAVEIANSYGSYVGAHSYTSDAMLAALDAGVMTLEHAFMFNSKINKKMKKKKAYMTTNLTAFSPALAEIDALADARTAKKLKSAQAAFGTYIENVKKYKPKRGYQTDCVGDAVNFETLKSMTSVGGEIAKLSGDVVNPYTDGDLGVIKKGAYADILLVDGNPLEDITVIGGREEWFTNDAKVDASHLDKLDLIMKDGKIYKNEM